MASDAGSILMELRRVDVERARRLRDPELGVAVGLLKAYQQERFRLTYSDLLGSSRFGAAARFFLEELYGPTDFSARDAQFARVVPALVRLFPHEVVQTVLALARLHALTEELDSQMADVLRGEQVARPAYARAWRAVGRRSDRERQIELTLLVGVDLDRLTRKPLLRHTLHLMRGPARAAGLAGLQAFLESGFDAFSSMRGAQPFLDQIDQRERALVDALFDESAAGAHAGGLGQLP